MVKTCLWFLNVPNVHNGGRTRLGLRLWWVVTKWLKMFDKYLRLAHSISIFRAHNDGTYG